MKNTPYYRQAELLLKVLPHIEKENAFALKGGTAINFFVRDMPRLSIDIDLAYVQINDRESALTHITESLVGISTNIKRAFQNCSVFFKHIPNTRFLNGMIVNKDGITVKIEPNLVIRGTVYKPERRKLSVKAENLFEISLDVTILAFSELFAGKICAALDRQHPRDLFDIHLLLLNEGIDDTLRKAFIVYLISHPRPMIELLDPNLLDIQKVFDNEFKGMTRDTVGLQDLLETRNKLIISLKRMITKSEKEFLISFKKAQPKWDLLGHEGIPNLPAVKWKLFNIGRMDKRKHEIAVEKLRNYLEA